MMAPAHDDAQQAPDPERLKSWWMGFKRRGGKKDPPRAPIPEPPKGIFGVPLQDSIKYANVAISLTDENGKSFIYGYVPIVVAKCGVFLKEKATDVEGIFRLSGSAKRIKELQAQFDTPTRYGKGLDWTGYTVHDAANVLRRYLNQLPQPIVPLESYEKFRAPLRDHQTQAVGDMEAQVQDVGNFDHEKTITTYQQLITEMPPLNRQLLLYVLDLLSVFASKSDINRMTSANLAAIFQPGLISHPIHDMKPQEYRLSQYVLIFLIENQDSFLIGMNGTAADAETVREVQSGAPSPAPGTPNRATTGIGRSASSASASNESQRRLGGIRRNLSVSSRNSRGSAGPNAPNSPASVQHGSSSGGVHRSNTVPSKKSPALSSRVNRGLDSPNTPIALSPALVSPAPRSTSPGTKLTPAIVEQGDHPKSSSTTPTADQSSSSPPAAQHEVVRDHSKERLIPGDTPPLQPTGEPSQGPGTPAGKSRNFTSLLKSSPTVDAVREHRQPNKLRKKQPMQSSTQPSANSSTHSLQNGEDSSRFGHQHTPVTSPGLGIQSDPLSSGSQALQNTAATPISDKAPQIGEGLEESMGLSDLQTTHQASDPTLKAKSTEGSVRSKSSVTDHSELEQVVGDKREEPEKKRRWRFSQSARRSEQTAHLSSPPLVGTNRPAGASSSSVGSWSKARKSTSNDIPPAPLETVPSVSMQQGSKSESTGSKDREHLEDSEKRGLFGRLKDRIQHAKDERKEKEAEKERAKSPPRDHRELDNNKSNLSAITQDSTPIDTHPSEAAKRLPDVEDSKKADTADASVTTPFAGTEDPALVNLKNTTLTESKPESAQDSMTNAEKNENLPATG